MATINAQKNENKKEKNSDEEEKPKEVVIQGLHSGGVMLASGDRFGSKLFTSTELEQAIKCGVALQKKPIRLKGWWLSRST